MRELRFSRQSIATGFDPPGRRSLPTAGAREITHESDQAASHGGRLRRKFDGKNRISAGGRKLE
jgi:hypothetical protein